MSPVDMGTFACTDECEDLCSKSIADHILVYVPRLTEGDKVSSGKMPMEAIRVFAAKQEVDRLTDRIFQKKNKNDESDAFRHFVWSTLIAKSIGIEKAKVFLDAHEEDSTQTQNEKQMDLENNRQGLEYFKSTMSSGKAIELDQIEKEALKRLTEKKLRVISPKYDKIPDGYYSK